MQDELIGLLAILVLVLILLIYLYLSRLPPRGIRSSAWVREVLIAAAADEGFQDICTRLCKIESQHRDALRDFLLDERVIVSTRSPFFGGWAGLDTLLNCPRIALPNWGMENLMWAVAIHELFHVVRHVQGVTRFETEFGMPYLVGPAFRIQEEFIVWRKTVNVDFFGSVAALLATFLPFVVLAVIAMMLQAP